MIIFRVVILTKRDDEKYRCVIESLSAPTSSVSLGVQTTLILYEKGLKCRGSLSKHFIHLLLHDQFVEVAELISGFIEACKMAKLRGKYERKLP